MKDDQISSQSFSFLEIFSDNKQLQNLLSQLEIGTIPKKSSPTEYAGAILQNKISKTKLSSKLQILDLKQRAAEGKLKIKTKGS